MAATARRLTELLGGLGRWAFVVVSSADLQRLVGCRVSRVCLDHQVSLLLAERFSALLVIECRTTLRIGDLTLAMHEERPYECWSLTPVP